MNPQLTDRSSTLTRRADNPRRRCEGDAGAVLVEFALMLPILWMLVAAVFEYGSYFNQQNTLQRVVGFSGRVASNQVDPTSPSGSLRSAPLTDFNILQAINSGLSDRTSVKIKRVIVYNARLSGGAPPPSCLSINATGTTVKGVNTSTVKCNVYSPNQVLTTTPDGFPRGSVSSPSCQSGSWDGNWCFTARVHSGATPDQVGVYVELTYTPVTSMLPASGVSVSAYSVYQLEPVKS